MLLIGVLLLVVRFRSSSALAAAYGIAVTGDDAGHLAAAVHRDVAASGSGRVWLAAALIVPLLIIESASSSPTCSRFRRAAGCRCSIGG